MEPIQSQIIEKDDIQVDLLVSANCVKALELIKVISSEAQGPYAHKTVLGWCVVGPMGVNKAYLKEMKGNNNIIHEENSLKRANPHFVLKGSVRETDIATMLRRMYETEFTETQLQRSASSSKFNGFSFSDARFMELLER